MGCERKLQPPESRVLAADHCWLIIEGPVSVFSVDLRLLQLVRIVDVNRLPLGVEVDGANSAFAMTVPGRLGSTEGQVYLGADGRSVDVGNSGIQVANRRKRLVDVFGVERGRQAVLDPVGDFDGVFEVVAGRSEE